MANSRLFHPSAPEPLIEVIGSLGFAMINGILYVRIIAPGTHSADAKSRLRKAHSRYNLERKKALGVSHVAVQQDRPVKEVPKGDRKKHSASILLLGRSAQRRA